MTILLERPERSCWSKVESASSSVLGELQPQTIYYHVADGWYTQIVDLSQLHTADRPSKKKKKKKKKNCQVMVIIRGCGVWAISTANSRPRPTAHDQNLPGSPPPSIFLCSILHAEGESLVREVTMLNAIASNALGAVHTWKTLSLASLALTLFTWLETSFSGIKSGE